MIWWIDIATRIIAKVPFWIVGSFIARRTVREAKWIFIEALLAVIDVERRFGTWQEFHPMAQGIFTSLVAVGAKGDHKRIAVGTIGFSRRIAERWSA